jgi:hypothetical protein
MTRTDDVFVPLAERVRIARQRQAQLFISIHADALGRGDGDAQGATIYTLSETASDAEAGRLAEAENKADVIAGVDLSSEPGDVADILIDLAQRETKTFSPPFCPQPGQRDQDRGPHAQESAQIGGLPGAARGGCPIGAARTGLCVEPGGPQAVDLGSVALAHGRRDRWGRGYLFQYPLRRTGGRSGRSVR